MQVPRVAIERLRELSHARSIETHDVQFLGRVTRFGERVADEGQQLAVRGELGVEPASALRDELPPPARGHVDREDVGIAKAEIRVGVIEAIDDDRAAVW